MLGETISHYKIIEKLGQGGMGEVYLAQDIRLGRKVALKFLAPELARDRESLVRFRNEARAAAELSHPNIATIYDFDEADQKPFLVLEYLDGQTLRERCAQGPLPIEDVIRIGKSLAAGLSEAHSQGIVHRDIKSANVMLTAKGGVKILDFGLARRIDATQITREGTTLGTIGYMSPEQARGEPADERSDIWSLGIVLYECLTGRLPFIGEGASILEQIKTTEPAPPTALRTGIPLELEQAVLRCMERSPQLRYQHADEVLATLKAVESHSGADAITTLSRSAMGSARPRPPWRTPQAFLVATVAVLVAAGLTIRPWERDESAPVPDRGEFTVAVIDFQDATAREGVTPGVTMTSLVQGSLIESSPCRVLTLEYLKDVRRRLFGTTSGPIQVAEALEIARSAGASSLVVADVIQSADEVALSWRLMDTVEGTALGAGRVRSSDIFDAADSTVAGIVPALARACGVEAESPPTPVTDLTTHSEDAYHHYLVGIEALNNYDTSHAMRELLEAVALDSIFAQAYFALSQTASQVRMYAERTQYADRAWELRARMDLRSRLRLEAWRVSIDFDLQRAMSIYQEILERWPDDRQTIDDLATLYGRFWMFDEIIELASEATRLYPDDSYLIALSAEGLIWKGLCGEAIGVLREHLEQNPKDTRLWNDLGDAYFRDGDPDSAAIHFRHALDIEPNLLGPAQGLAYVAFARGDVEGMISRLESLLEREVYTGDKHNILYQDAFRPGLTQLAIMRGQYERSRQYFEDALRYVGPIQQEAYRGRYLLATGQPHLALEIAQQLSAGQTRREEHYGTRLRASALVALDSLERAREAVEDVLRWAESEGNLYLYHARRVRTEIALKENQPEQALNQLRAIQTTGIITGMWHMECWELEAEALRRLGRYDEAVERLRELLRVYGGYALGHYRLAQIHEEMTEFDEAEAEYTKFLEMWADADEGLPELEDARRRLRALQSRS